MPDPERDLPWDAGPPDRAVNMDEVLAVLMQTGLSSMEAGASAA